MFFFFLYTLDNAGQFTDESTGFVHGFVHGWCGVVVVGFGPDDGSQEVNVRSRSDVSFRL